MRLLIPLILVVTTACSPVFKLSTRQGNMIDDDKLAQVNVGMTQEQVHYLMGSPLIHDEFEPNRWDYAVYFRTGDGEEFRRTVSLYFDGDTLQRIDDSKPPQKAEEDAVQPEELTPDDQP